MKSILFLAITATAMSANAGWFLKRHTGTLTSTSNHYHCSFKNKTNNSLDMKYVVFYMDSTFDKGGSTTQQDRIDHVIRSGESAKYSMEKPVHYTVSHCTYLAR
ncbi:hypothetical protein [Bdellovibrio sp. HCB337]|uniref:hypothetical protein n=1 Tax=Bdellovibrio sp. HCB337 TaxID=3394358 RepID=UPI0039A488D1